MSPQPEVSVTKDPSKHLFLTNTTQLLWMFSNLPYQCSSVAAKHLRPQQDETAKIQPFNHARPRQ